MTTTDFAQNSRSAAAIFAIVLMTGVSTVEAEGQPTSGTTLRFAGSPAPSHASAPVRLGNTMRFRATPAAEPSAVAAAPGTTLRFAAPGGAIQAPSGHTLATNSGERPVQPD